jgi:hypothetical protein
LVAALPEVTMPLPGSAVTLLPGARSHDQARSLIPIWEPLTAALKSLDGTGQDVIVDAGWLGLQGSPEALIYGADLTLLLTRTDLVSLSGARSWAETLREGFERNGATAGLRVLLVGEAQPYRAREVSKVLRLPVLSSIEWDPPAAAVLSKGAAAQQRGVWHRLAGQSGFDSSPLLRSLRAATSSAAATLRENREQLETAGGAG